MNECEVVRDLIPLYAENMASGGSRELVEKYIAACTECHAVLKQATENKIVVNSTEPLKKMKRGFRRYTAEIVVMSVSLTMAALVNGWIYCVDPADEMGFTLTLMYAAIPLAGCCAAGLSDQREGG